MPVDYAHRGRGTPSFPTPTRGNHREPVHVHVRKGVVVAKFWLYPEVCLVKSYGLNSQEQGTLAGIVAERRQEIEEAWHGFFS